MDGVDGLQFIEKVAIKVFVRLIERQFWLEYLVR